MNQISLSDQESAGLSVGGLLRAHRIARHERLQTVADTLRIRIGYLEAIEENRLERLPALVYAVGYVKSYAKHLGLDPTRVGERFRRDYLTARSLVPELGLVPQPERTLGSADRSVGQDGLLRRWFG